jgi:uncharacterized protein (TIGR03435 family)
MFRRFIATALIAAGIAFAQAPAFEVATIRPAPPLDPAQIMQGKMHVGMNIDKARVDIGFMSLADLIRTAYEVKAYQVSGPDWMNSERFDILAKMPDGATKDQVPAMLRALLADRFKLTIHKEGKDHAVYALVVEKNGPKLKDAPPDPAPGPDGAPPGTGGITLNAGENGPVRINRSADGNGATMTAANGGTARMAMGSDGSMHMEWSKVAMPAFAEMLTRFTDRPVVDDTGLKGNYQVSLELSRDDLMRVVRAAGMAAPGMMPAAPAGSAADAASDPASGSVFTAVQQLGLKLDPRKEPVETIMVDHIEKTPTEN